MAKRAFAFALGQRVNVPGKKGVQGVVSLPLNPAEIGMADVPERGPIDTGCFFPVAWVDGDGRRGFAWFTQTDLMTATRRQTKRRPSR